MNLKHGKARSRPYNKWMSMLDRCRNPNSPAYKNYGGRGIVVCERWLDFAQFHADMGDPPPGHSLERVDNNRGYDPDNCVWADRRAQGRNKRNNVLITIDGETMPLSAWAERFGIKYTTAHQRIWKYGWSPEDAVKTPLVKERKGIPRGERIHKFGARHGVTFHDQQESAA
jgi:hypothetical protein